VDLIAGVIRLFSNGNLACEVKHQDINKDGRFSVSQQVCLLGSRDPTEMLGGNLRWCLFETRALSREDAQLLYAAAQEEGKWNCPQCTFRNSISATHCALCNKPRVFDKPVSAAEAADKWPCSVCTYLNSGGNQCALCAVPRLERQVSASSLPDPDAPQPFF